MQGSVLDSLGTMIRPQPLRVQACAASCETPISITIVYFRIAQLRHSSEQAAQAELQQRADSAMAQARVAASDREASLVASLEDQRTDFQVASPQPHS